MLEVLEGEQEKRIDIVDIQFLRKFVVLKRIKNVHYHDFVI